MKKRFSFIKHSMATALMAINGITFAAVGEQWEYSGTVEMMGMQMPIQATKVCQKPDQGNTPPMEGNCTFSDVKVQGNTTSFSFKCPPDGGSGSGTTTRTGDTLESSYQFEAAGTTSKVNMKGRKLGSCDLR